MPTNKLRANMSYREVIPKNLSPPEWIDVKINTGRSGAGGQVPSSKH